MAVQSDLMLAIKQIAAERKIDVDEILDAIKQAIKYGFKSAYGLENLEKLDVEMEADEGYIGVFATKNVVAKVTDELNEISLEEAKKLDKKAKIGGEVKVDITPTGDFGRIAAQSARQVILQKLRESEKESAIKELEDKIGGIENVRIQKILPNGDILCEINRAKAIMPKEERVGTEFYKLGNAVKVLLKSIEDDAKGKYILVSRAAPEFLKALFKIEVPEIDSGSVEIVAVAREEGSRSKVAVTSHSEGIDPIGSCVGQKGVRINAIMNELSLGRIEEKVDIILWDENEEYFIQNSLSPAEVLSVKLDKKQKKATVTVPNDQYSLAIGRDGQNVRLASKLTGWDIDIQAENPADLESSSKETVGKSEDLEENDVEE